VAVSRRELGSPDGRRGTGIATTVVRAGRAGGHLPPGRLARLLESGQDGAEPEPYSDLILGVYHRFTCLAWAALQLPGVEVEEVSM
jgi:hypothetical protein